TVWHDATRIRRDQLVEHGSMLRVTQRRADLGQIRKHADAALAPQAREAIDRQQLELFARFRQTSRVEVDDRQTRARYGARRKATHEELAGGLLLGQQP